LILFLIKCLISHSKTINLLLERGYNDALDGFNEYIQSQTIKTADNE
jgi:hypothetical protein